MSATSDGSTTRYSPSASRDRKFSQHSASVCSDTVGHFLVGAALVLIIETHDIAIFWCATATLLGVVLSRPGAAGVGERRPFASPKAPRGRCFGFRHQLLADRGYGLRGAWAWRLLSIGSLLMLQADKNLQSGDRAVGTTSGKRSIFVSLLTFDAMCACCNAS